MAKHKNLWLFLALSSFFLVYPLASSLNGSGLLVEVLFTGSILLALYAQSDLSLRVKSLYLAIGVAAVACTWVDLYIRHVEHATAPLYVVFFAVSLVIFGRALFVRAKVDIDAILAAACTYIIMGFLFASLFMIIVQYQPGAFVINDDRQDIVVDMIYFSFVTLTTLGYGDIAPVSPMARMLATYEAVVGQIFIAVVVAGLVGAHISHRSAESGT